MEKFGETHSDRCIRYDIMSVLDKLDINTGSVIAFRLAVDKAVQTAIDKNKHAWTTVRF